MKKLFWPLLVLGILGGCLALGGRISARGIEMPSGTTIEQDTLQTIPNEPPLYLETTTTTTLPPPPDNQSNFDHPAVKLTARGTDGDEIELRETIGRPHSISMLPSDVASTLRSCTGVTERDMAVEVNSQVRLKSALKADVNINFGVIGQPAAFGFTAGLECSDSGQAHFDMKPQGVGRLRYWVVLSGVITPDHPKGDFGHQSFTLPAPMVSLPNLQTVISYAWGSAVVRCDTILGPDWKIRLAGAAPKSNEKTCQPIVTKDQAEN